MHDPSDGRKPRDDASVVEAIAAMGLKQAELARLLGVSQGHLSKVLRHRTRPGRSLVKRMWAMSAAAPPSARDAQWLTDVERAAQASAAFKAVVDAALRLMH